MSLTSPQECGRVKRQKLNDNKQQKPLDLSSVHQRLVERKKALNIQRQQYIKCWKCARESIDGEFRRRQKELEGARVPAHKNLDEIHQSCEFQVEALTKQLQRDIELVKSLRSLKVVERDVSKTLELVKRASNPLTLCILPTVTFKDGEMEIKLSDLHVKGLSELISESSHRCFSHGVVGLVASYANTVEFEGKCCLKLKGHKYANCVVGLRGGRVATGHDDGSIHIYDSQSGKWLFKLIRMSFGVTTLAVVGDNQLLSVSKGETLCLWDLQTGQLVRVLEGHTDDVVCVCVFADSKGVSRAASGSLDKTIRIWDLDSGDCIQVLRGHTEGVRCLSVTTDGSRRLVSGSWDRALRVWSIETGECLRVLNGHVNWMNSVQILNDQKRVISASADRTLRIWDIESGECLRVINIGWINSVSVFSGSNRVISGGADELICVWDMDTGECLKVVSPNSNIWRVCCLVDGRVVIVTAGEVQIWE